MEQWYVWLAIVIILTVLELATVNLTTIWFVISGIIALIVSFFTDSYLIQFGIFVLLGVILLITTRPVLLGMLKHKRIPTNVDRVIGASGVVTEEIKKNKPGEVKVDGKHWTAIADKEIEKGKNIIVCELRGVKLKVEEEK